MGAKITLKTKDDGSEFGAWRATPDDARRGGLVVLHAIWGVTPHIRELCDELAGQGYEAIAPDLLHRFGPGFPEVNIDPAMQALRSSYGEAAGWGADLMGEVQAAIDALEPPVFAMGFCFGGTVAWLAACRCEGLSAVSCFYGGGIADHRDETPRRPTILHFGKTDPLIPLSEVEAIEAAHPDLPIWLYDAGHAFVAPGENHRPDAARLAMLRTLQLFQRSAGPRAEA